MKIDHIMSIPKKNNAFRPLRLLLMTLVAFCMSSLSWAQSFPPVEPYANGTPIVIGVDAGDYNWTNSEKLYGGSLSGTLNSSTNITINNSTKAHLGGIWGGSRTGDVKGLAKVTVNTPWPPEIFNQKDSGFLVWPVFGGNEISGSVDSTLVVMNSGWVRAWIYGGGGTNETSGYGVTVVNGDSRVLITGGFIGGPMNMVVTQGQGEVFGGGQGTVKGNTYVTVRGNKYESGKTDDMTIIRRHLCGGGVGSFTTNESVKGNTYVNIEGGSIGGNVAGGGGSGSNVVDGSTFVHISGGEVKTISTGDPGGNLSGGGYAVGNIVKGNTNVRISGTAYIGANVYGGCYGTLGASNTVLGNATVIIENGRVAGSVYAGGRGSPVAGVATVILQNMNNTNGFVQSFTTSQSILPGVVSAATGKSVMLFDNFTATNFVGKIGSSSSVFDTLRLKNNTRLTINPSNGYYAKSWTLENGTSLELKGNTATVSTTGTVQNAGKLTLDAAANLTVNFRGAYLASANGSLVMSATSNTAKDYLNIAGTAQKYNGNSTRIELTLNPLWNGLRINLIEALATGSDADAFVLAPVVINGKEVKLKNEVSGSRMIWYIEGTPLEVVKTAVSNNANPAKAFPGDIITYTIIVTNISENPVLNLSMFDPIPDSSKYVDGSATCSQAGVNGALNGTKVEWTPLSSLAPAASVTYTFKVRVKGVPQANGDNKIYNVAYAVINTKDTIPSTGSTCTFAEITVLEINAVDDYITIFACDEVAIDVLANDYTPENGTEVTVLGPSTLGVAPIINGDGTISYIASCMSGGKTDVFTYKICTTKGECDEAQVYITILAVPQIGLIDSCSFAPTLYVSPQMDNATYQWYTAPTINGAYTEMAGEINPKLIIPPTGYYKVKITIDGGLTVETDPVYFVIYKTVKFTGGKKWYESGIE